MYGYGCMDMDVWIWMYGSESPMDDSRTDWMIGDKKILSVRGIKLISVLIFRIKKYLGLRNIQD